MSINDFESKVQEHKPTMIFKQGPIWYAIGSLRFLVANWDTHHLKTYEYTEIIVSAGSDAAFVDPASMGQQEISFIKLHVADEEFKIEASNHQSLSEFLQALSKRIIQSR